MPVRADSLIHRSTARECCMPVGAFGFSLRLPTGLQMFIMNFLTVNPTFVQYISLEAVCGNWQTSADRWHKETQRTKNVSKSDTLTSSKFLKINCCPKAWAVTWKFIRKTPTDSSSSISFNLLLNNIHQPLGFDKMLCKMPWVVYERETESQTASGIYSLNLLRNETVQYFY